MSSHLYLGWKVHVLLLWLKLHKRTFTFYSTNQKKERDIIRAGESKDEVESERNFFVIVQNCNSVG